MDGLTQLIRDYVINNANSTDKITENDLMERFNVGRSSVREALKELESEKLIDRKRSLGITLHRYSMRDIAEIYDLRSTLEGFACGLATSVITSNELKKLEKLAHDYAEASVTSSFDSKQVSEYDVAFHSMLIEISGNRKLKEIMNGFSIIRQAFMIYAPHFRRQRAMRSTPYSHLEIVKAIKSADPSAAERLMREHVLWAKRRLLEQFASPPLD